MEKVNRNEDAALVSVIIPTYKRNDTLTNAIDSILKQTYTNLEIIVVDDNGEESPFRKQVEAIMRGYEADSRIRYVKNPKNLGGAGARNVGIEAAGGKYLAFLDDDDTYYPDKIAKQVALFENSKDEKLALVYCYVEQLDCNGNVTYVIKKDLKGNCLYESMCTDCLAPTSLWLVKKECVMSVGMFSIVPCKQDSTLILKLLRAGYTVDYVPEILCSYANFGIGEKITNYSMRNIEGELLYREACRQAYQNFTKSQKNAVEFEFLRRLYRMYRFNHMKKEVSETKREMRRISLLATWKFFLRSWLHDLKNAWR